MPPNPTSGSFILVLFSSLYVINVRTLVYNYIKQHKQIAQQNILRILLLLVM